MKWKNQLVLLFALIFMFISTVPSFAIEDELPPATEQEETDPIQPSEDETEPEEPPVLPDDLEEPGEEPPVEPEDPEAPPEEDNPEVPGDEEPSDEDDPDEGIPNEGNPDEGSPDEDNPDSVPDEDAEDEEEELFINVLVPASGQVIVNPYHMSVGTSTGEVTDQIVHEPQMLESFTECSLQVSVQVMGSLRPWSDARFVSAPPTDDVLDKEIFMYAEFQSDPDQWSYTYDDGENQVMVMDWRTEKENVLSLGVYGIGYFRLFGAMTPFPADMWTEDDVMTVTLAFTFTPAEESAAFAAEVPEESFDTIFNDSPDAVFDDVQAVAPNPLPDIIPEPVPGQNPGLTSEVDLEPELGAMDILDSFERTVPVLNSEKEIKYPQ